MTVKKSEKTVWVDFAEVFHDHVWDGENYRSPVNLRGEDDWRDPLSDLPTEGKEPSPTNSGLVLSFMQRQYDVGASGAIEATPITTDKDRQHAIKVRKEQIEAWEKSGRKQLQALAKTASAVWFPNGKPVVPKYFANGGHRRAIAILGAIHANNYGEEKPNYSFEIPVEVREYEGELERFERNVGLNLLDTKGKSSLSQATLLRAARKLVGFGRREADLVKIGMNRGLAQRLFSVATLDAMYPELRLVERCNMNPPVDKEGQPLPIRYDAEGYIPLSSLDKEELRKMREGEEGFEDAEGVERGIKKLVTKEGNKRRMMSQNDVGQKAKTHESHFVRYICKAVQENRPTIFDKIASETEFCQKVDELAREAGILPATEKKAEKKTAKKS